MPASWVAASVRGRLLAGRRLGRTGAAAVAGSGSLVGALQLLAGSPYGDDVTTDMTLESAQRHTAATLMWNLRLLAGWLPPGGSQILQPLAAWFEIANIEERLVYLEGGGHAAPYELGSLATAWKAVSNATTADAVREALARSRWGDPGSSEPAAMLLTLRLRWAAWIAMAVPDADVWSATACALLAARILFAPARPEIPSNARAYGLPAGWHQAPSPFELRAMMPRQTSWILEGITDPSELWRAEARWWLRVKTDAREMLVRSWYGPTVVVAAVALLAYDAWLTRAALAAAERGAAARRVFDAVA